MNLRAIVRAYIYQRRPTYQAELNWFRQQPSLESAIRYAALATRPDGKRHAHQSRLTKETLETAKQVLLANAARLTQSRTFDDLLNLIATLLGPIRGAGPLYIYDTALRIGKKLG